METAPATPRDLSEGFFTHDEAGSTVTLRLDPEAAWVIEYYPVEKVTSRAEGVTEVEMRIGDRRWLQRLMLRLAPHARVLEPADVADEVEAAVRATLALYS